MPIHHNLMTHTVFDILTTAAGNPESEDHALQQEKASLCAHLGRLLNSRRESLVHIPYFGMPDIAELYLGLPYTCEAIIASIRFAIEQFEPRLQNLQLKELDMKAGQSRTHFELIGTTQSKRSLRFIISLCRTGWVEVKTSEEYFTHV